MSLKVTIMRRLVMASDALVDAAFATQDISERALGDALIDSVRTAHTKARAVHEHAVHLTTLASAAWLASHDAAAAAAALEDETAPELQALGLGTYREG